MSLKFEEYDFYESDSRDEYDFEEYYEDSDELCESEKPNLLDSLLTDVFENSENLDVDSAIDTFSNSDGIKTEEKSEYDKEENSNSDEDCSLIEETKQRDSQMGSDDVKKKYLEEESNVDLDLIPDFCMKHNVYGTTFSVSNGHIEKPRNITNYRRYKKWVKISIKENLKNFSSLLQYDKIKASVNYGTKVKYPNSKFIRLETRTPNEVESMETKNIQKLIIESFQSGKLSVLYIGVINNLIVGCQMSITEQDYLRLALDTALQTEFQPPIGNILDTIDIRFIPVTNAPENQKDLFLVVIWVKKLRKDIYKLSSNEV